MATPADARAVKSLNTGEGSRKFVVSYLSFLIFLYAYEKLQFLFIQVVHYFYYWLMIVVWNFFFNSEGLNFFLGWCSTSPMFNKLQSLILMYTDVWTLLKLSLRKGPRFFAIA